MSALRIAPATSIDRAAFLAALNAGYAGYEVPMHLDEAAFTFMVKLVDIDLARSVVGWDGDAIAATAMLAVRDKHSWIGGMGVPPEFRGRGYGLAVMQAAIANARKAGARVMQLEVLVNNAPAIRIYEALGFRRTRGLGVWLIEPGAAASAPAPAGAADELVTLDHGAALDLIDHWSPEPPPWQRAPESIAHLPDAPAALGRMRDGGVAAAIVYRGTPERASILGLAARAAGDEDSLALLLAGLQSRHPGVPIRLLNLPEGDPAEPVLVRAGAKSEARQIEMRLEL